ncbi:MAG: 50S ribosomal protein L25 [Actinobacteria bacterium]|nr:50S ribosomal protein L25 [Actinomycetota bacterium]
MPEIALPVEIGRSTGSRPAGRLRAAGKIPAIVYGHGLSPVAVAVEGRALRAALMTEAGLNALMSVKLDGTEHLVMARDIQRDPVRHRVTHVDFQIVRRDEIMTVEVPIALVGEAELVNREGGVVAQELFSLSVNATPGNIPNSIEIDITELAVGDAVRVSDIKLPSGASTDVDPEAAIVVGQPPQAVVEEVAEGEEGAEGVEGAEGEAEGGDAEAPSEASE